MAAGAEHGTGCRGASVGADERGDEQAPAVRSFLLAAEVVADLLARAEVAERWVEPSEVEGFTVGGMAGHLYGATRRLEATLDEPVPEEPIEVDLSDFYGANRVGDRAELEAGIHPWIRQDAEERAERGAAWVATRFRAMVERLRERLADEDPERLVSVLQVPHGVTRLRTYLVTRVIELVVHGDDLAVSVGLPDLELPPGVATTVIDACVDLSRARTSDLDVIRGFARRERTDPEVLRAL